jgi:hypothetical protein
VKRKNLSTILAILTAIGLLCGLAACSSGEKAAPTKPPAAQATQPPAKPPTSTPKPATPTPEEAKPTAKPAEPTATPVPPSPTPAAEAKPATLVANPEDALDSYRARIEMELVEEPEGLGEGEEPGLGDVFAMMFDDWVMEVEWVREPEARHTVSTHSGLIPDTESIEIGDTMWLKVGDDWIQTSSGLSGAEATAQQELQLDFEDLLGSLEGGLTPIGAETVDDIHCQKYNIDTDYAMAFPIPEDTSEEARQSMPSEMAIHVQGELWIADQRDLPPVVIRSQTTQELSFEIASQTITLVYREERHLYDINEPITIEPPEGAMAIPTVPSEPSVKEPTPQAEQPGGPAEVASLDDLDSYRLDWSVQVQMSAGGGVTMNYTLEWVREPPSGHLVTGLGEYIWIDDTFWVKVGDTWMQGSQEEAENAFDQLGDIMEPDSDMVLAGEETVNGVHCQHYVYDLGDTMHKEIWVADQSDLPPVVIRGMFRMETSQMVTEAEGNVYDINTPITIEPPK